MPIFRSEREKNAYQLGFADGYSYHGRSFDPKDFPTPGGTKPKPKRKLSPWNKFVKANSNKPRFRYKSGANKGKLNLKKMGVAFRKTPAGKKKR